MRVDITQRISLEARFTCSREELYVLHARILRAALDINGAYGDATVSAYFNGTGHREWPLGDLETLMSYDYSWDWKPQHEHELTVHIPPLPIDDAEGLRQLFQSLTEEK